MKTTATKVTEHVYGVGDPAMYVFLIVLPESLTLIDAGFPGNMAQIDEAVRSLGRQPEEIGDVLVTHCHPDHVGGLAEIKAATGARVWMHPADAELVRGGRTFRPWKRTPGLRNWVFCRLVIGRSPQTCTPVPVDREVLPEETIPVAGGIKALGTPGHTEGHLAFHWPGDGGVLFVGDAAKHVGRLRTPPIFEDMEQGLQSLRMLARESFDTACFAHGPPIVGEASQEFQRVWG